MYHQTIRSRHILFHIALCYNYFSNFILFTKDFSISLSVFLFINNINSVFYDNNIHAISSGTLTSQICRFLKSSFSTFKNLIFIVFLSEYHTLYLNLTYDFISKKILATQGNPLEKQTAYSLLSSFYYDFPSNSTYIQ